MKKRTMGRHALGVLAFVLTASILAGCSSRSSYRITPLKRSELRVAAKSCFTMPRDYATGWGRAENSGAETQQALQKGLAQKAGETVFASAAQSQGQAIAAARAAGCEYLVAPEILAWEDPPSFRKRLDRGEVMLRVYDVPSGELLRMDAVSCTGQPAMFNYGTYSPGNCLEPAFARWAQETFTKN